MSDFGFDAYALDDAEPAGHPHPLEIARDLIATGKARAALEALETKDLVYLHVDALAARGARFTNAFCTTPSCAASRAL